MLNNVDLWGVVLKFLPLRDALAARRLSQQLREAGALEPRKTVAVGVDAPTIREALELVKWSRERPARFGGPAAVPLETIQLRAGEHWEDCSDVDEDIQINAWYGMGVKRAILIDEDVRIVGAGRQKTTLLNGLCVRGETELDPPFVESPVHPISVEIEGLTIRNTADTEAWYGVVVADGAIAKMSNCKIVGADDGLFVGRKSLCTLESCEITDFAQYAMRLEEPPAKVSCKDVVLGDRLVTAATSRDVLNEQAYIVVESMCELWLAGSDWRRREHGGRVELGNGRMVLAPDPGAAWPLPSFYALDDVEREMRDDGWGGESYVPVGWHQKDQVLTLPEDLAYV